MSCSTKSFFSKYVSTTVSINSLSLGANFTGFIKKFVDGRAIIVTCAHAVLYNEGLDQKDGKPATIAYPITGTFNNVLAKGSKVKENVNVSLCVLGMDISADIAVLFSFLPSEVIDYSNNGTVSNIVNPISFGFEFSSRNLSLKWGDSINFLQGDPVYCIGDAYSNGIDMNNGICSNNDFIYSPDNVDYTNFSNQFLSSINVEQGTSGGAVLDKKGKVQAMVAWRKTEGGNYVGGPSQFTLQNSYERIRQLNPINKIKGFYEGVNFDGNVNPVSPNYALYGVNLNGWTGLQAYEYMNSQAAIGLKLQYPNDTQLSKADGIVITSIAPDGTYGIPKIPFNNAYNSDTKTIEPLLVNDIMLSIDGTTLNYFIDDLQIASTIYYDVNATITLYVYRPSTQKYYNFIVGGVPFPNELNYVSTDSSLTLITDSKAYAYLAIRGGDNLSVTFVFFATANSNSGNGPVFAGNFYMFTLWGSGLLDLFYSSGQNFGINQPVIKNTSTIFNYVVGIAQLYTDNSTPYTDPIEYTTGLFLPITLNNANTLADLSIYAHNATSITLQFTATINTKGSPYNVALLSPGTTYRFTIQGDGNALYTQFQDTHSIYQPYILSVNQSIFNYQALIGGGNNTGITFTSNAIYYNIGPLTFI